jgi:hypothetical protein
MELFNILAGSVTAGDLFKLSEQDKEQAYYACVELLFLVIILVGILWQFRRNGNKIRLLEGRMSKLEKKLEGK